MTEIGSEQTRPLTVKEWFITILVLAIPLVNIVMYFMWGFGDGVNENKRNFCRASLLWAAICIAIGIVIAMFAGLGAFLSSRG